jgi:transcriptional regulator with XRE-family HTH domain
MGWKSVLAVVMNEPNETVRDLNRKAIAERLRLAISETGLTLDRFATDAGVSVSGLKKWLSGVSDPAFGSIVDAARVAGVRLDWLATGKGPMRDDDAARPASPEAYDPEIVHSVAWFLAQRRGDAPKDHADLFVTLCDYLRDNSSESDMSKVADIIDFTLRRVQK